MASFFRNTFDNLVNNINSTLNQQSSASQRSHNRASQNSTTDNTTRARTLLSRRPDSTSTSTNQQQQQLPRVLRRNIPRYYNNSHTASRSDDLSRTQRSTDQHRDRPQQEPQHNHTSPQQRASGMDNVAYSNVSSDKLDIGDVRDPGEINNLSAKQLKVLLTRNCVDYKGIFEKEVLREKVMQLWIDHNERKERKRAAQRTDGSQGPCNLDDDDDIDENQVCKICMEREINCVLLECGHMLTCVTCGRKLAECPICRQNVTRCVRTFKS